VLLKEIVARASGTSFAEFARRRLFAPLGMTSSAYVPDVLQAGGNAALGYQKVGAGWTPYMRLGNARGGGAIVSTVGDLLVWNDALTSGRLGTFVTGKLQERTRLSNGRTLQYARGLIVDATPGGTVVSHSGGAAGFSTWLGASRSTACRSRVACNFDPVSATALAAASPSCHLPPATPQAQRRRARSRPRGRRRRQGGLYFDARTGEPMRLTANNGRLHGRQRSAARAGERGSVPPQRASLSFRSEDDVRAVVPVDDEFECGRARARRRVPPRAAWTPTPADLRAVDGPVRERGARLGVRGRAAPTGSRCASSARRRRRCSSARSTATRTCSA
jgi:hypothetical protein